MYKRILLAVDGSENSLRATDEAVKIASLIHDCIIEIIYVADFSKVKNEVLHSQGKEELGYTRRKRLAPIEQKVKSNNIEYKLEILHGNPGQRLLSMQIMKKLI